MCSVVTSGILQSAQQRQNVAARGPAIDAVFMLQTDEIVAIEVQEISGPLIGGNVLLVQFQAHLFRIIVARIGIVDGNGEQRVLPRIRLRARCTGRS